MIYIFLFTIYYLLDKKQLNLVETLARSTTFPLFRSQQWGKNTSTWQKRIRENDAEMLTDNEAGDSTKNSMNKCSLLMRKLREFNEKDAETLTRKEKWMWMSREWCRNTYECERIHKIFL